MCGIAGLWNLDRPAPDRETIIKRMVECLRHRGPDGTQFLTKDNATLGHARLAIIAPDPSANQPMTRGPYTIVYNGELYNYREEKARLKAKGFYFQTESDTEVILALYEEGGTNCFQHMNGIFAFALYDERQKILVCARDHFGINPLLYARAEKGIIFASELKSILSSNLIERKVDNDALTLLMQTGSIPQPYTMVEGIKSLMPGHFMVCSNDNIHIERYYTLRQADISFKTDTEWQSAIHEKIRAAVKDQLVSDVPLGAFLSGGVDSGVIAALMKECSANVKTYSVGFEHSKSSGQYDETDEAAAVAHHLGTDHHTFTITDVEAKTVLPSIIRGIDHPSIDGMNSYFVSQTTSRHVRVALSGTGADEIFGGYVWFANMRDYENADILQKLKYTLKGQDYLSYYKSLHGVFSKTTTQKLLGKNYTNTKRPLQPNLKNSHGIARTSDLVISSFLQNQLLPDINTAALTHGLEVRVPYLSVDLVETALAMPDHMKLGTNDNTAIAGSYAAEGTKKVLIDIARQYLPEGFDNRPKRGFAMPMARWLETIWKEDLAEATSTQTIKNRGLFDADQVSTLRESSNLPWTQNWLLMSVELWCRHVLDESRAA